MIADITHHREELRDLCRRFHVRRLDVFGSAARGDFDSARSDIDFLVEFDSSAPEALSLKTYLGLKVRSRRCSPERSTSSRRRHAQSLSESRYRALAGAGLCGVIPTACSGTHAKLIRATRSLTLEQNENILRP
jgi:hypothetical protein